MDTDFAELIKHYRHEAGLTQAQVAEAVQRSASAVQGWERGRSVPSDPEIVARLAKVLGIPDDVAQSRYRHAMGETDTSGSGAATKAGGTRRAIEPPTAVESETTEAPAGAPKAAVPDVDGPDVDGPDVDGPDVDGPAGAAHAGTPEPAGPEGAVPSVAGPSSSSPAHPVGEPRLFEEPGLVEDGASEEPAGRASDTVTVEGPPAAEGPPSPVEEPAGAEQETVDESDYRTVDAVLPVVDELHEARRPAIAPGDDVESPLMVPPSVPGPNSPAAAAQTQGAGRPEVRKDVEPKTRPAPSKPPTTSSPAGPSRAAASPPVRPASSRPATGSAAAAARRMPTATARQTPSAPVRSGPPRRDVSYVEDPDERTTYRMRAVATALILLIMLLVMLWAWNEFRDALGSAFDAIRLRD